MENLYQGVVDRADAISDDEAAARLEASEAPRATLRIETTDPRWCAHLEPEMIWDVYAFDYGASYLL